MSRPGRRAGAATEAPEERLGTPFPLRRRFFRYVVPGLVLFLAALIGTTVIASRAVLEGVYLQQAQRRAQAIAGAAARAEPQAWANLLSGATLTKSDFAALQRALGRVMREFHLSRLRMYGLDAATLFSENPEQIGKIRRSDALQQVLSEGESGLRLKEEAGGSDFYELYVPYRDSAKHLRAVFELYEPVSYLDALLGGAALPIATVPGAMLLVLVAVLSLLVVRAQADIDGRTRAIDSLRKRLESFVSRRAMNAIRDGTDVSAMGAETADCTLLFSDVRGFTSFAESRTPEQVIGFLNRAMRLQVDVIESAGGDIDKMIGDALFARFHGPGRQAAAVRAAAEIHRRAGQEGLDRPLGIGVYSGVVITGPIGVRNRFDYTAVGDSVNVASRLCDAAAAGEIVADAATLDAAGPETGAGFGPPEALSVKGRRAPLTIRRRARG